MTCWIGRIDRTLFTLDWLQSPEPRRRVTARLNKGEAKNALSRVVCFHRRGMVQDRTFDDQRLRAGGLKLVVLRSCCGTRSTSNGRWKRCVPVGRPCQTNCSNISRHRPGNTSS